jgi:hypothetical protein
MLQMSARVGTLPELVHSILTCLDCTIPSDNTTLYACSLVNHTFKDSSRRVNLRHLRLKLQWLRPGDPTGFTVWQFFELINLSPHYAFFVKYLELYMSDDLNVMAHGGEFLELLDRLVNVECVKIVGMHWPKLPDEVRGGMRRLLQRNSVMFVEMEMMWLYDPSRSVMEYLLSGKEHTQHLTLHAHNASDQFLE